MFSASFDVKQLIGKFFIIGKFKRTVFFRYLRLDLLTSSGKFSKVYTSERIILELNDFFDETFSLKQNTLSTFYRPVLNSSVTR